MYLENIITRKLDNFKDKLKIQKKKLMDPLIQYFFTNFYYSKKSLSLVVEFNTYFHNYYYFTLRLNLTRYLKFSAF